MSEQSPGVLRRALSRLATSAKEHEAAELREDCARVGATLVKDLPSRERVVVAGTLRTVTLRPRAGVPALVAELYDGTGSISVIWLGRRQIPGIDPGRSIVCYGRVSFDEGQPVIFNPRYELRPVGSE
jgi:OB-fold nucleic acid binding protein